MASWSEIENDSPEFAARVLERFSRGTNKTIATLRKDGSPRISATELEITNGEVSFGMMGGSLKLADVRRDPRVAIHCATLEPPEVPNDPDWPGDAKLAGRLVEIDPPENNPYEGAGFFRVDIGEVVLTYVGTPPDHLVIETWHPGRGHERRTRR